MLMLLVIFQNKQAKYKCTQLLKRTFCNYFDCFEHPSYYLLIKGYACYKSFFFAKLHTECYLLLSKDVLCTNGGHHYTAHITGMSLNVLKICIRNVIKYSSNT